LFANITPYILSKRKFEKKFGFKEQEENDEKYGFKEQE